MGQRAGARGSGQGIEVGIRSSARRGHRGLRPGGKVEGEKRTEGRGYREFGRVNVEGGNDVVGGAGPLAPICSA